MATIITEKKSRDLELAHRIDRMDKLLKKSSKKSEKLVTLSNYNYNSCSPSFLLYRNLAPLNLVTTQKPTSHSSIFYFTSSTLHALLHMNLFYCIKFITHSKLELFRVILINLLLRVNLFYFILFFHVKNILHSTLGKFLTHSN